MSEGAGGARANRGVRPPIRVVLADDHGIVRDGLVAVLGREPGIEVARVVEDGEAAIAAIEELLPRVAVVDIAMPRLTGIEVCRRARELGLGCAVVLLSVHKEPSFVKSGLEAGAAGYVVKDAAARELVRAVEVVADGCVYLSPAVAGAVASALRGGRGVEAPALSPRERDVLRLLADGLTSKEVAARLGIATKTVDTHRAAIMDKLGVRHMAGLTKYAIRHHLTGLDP